MNLFMHSLISAVLFGCVLSEPMPQAGFEGAVFGFAWDRRRMISDDVIEISENANNHIIASKLSDVTEMFDFEELHMATSDIDIDYDGATSELSTDYDISSTAVDYYDISSTAVDYYDISSTAVDYYDIAETTISTYCGNTTTECLVLSEPMPQEGFADAMKGLAGDAGKSLSDVLLKVSEDVNAENIGSKFKDVIYDVLDVEDDIYSTTEFMGVDATGCDRGLRKMYEDRCDDQYDKINDEAQAVEDDSARTEAICCALEDFEKCSLRAFDKANCLKDKAAIRENLKAARLFLSVVANISCAGYRGRCAYYSSAVSSYSAGLATTVLAAILSFKILL